MTEDDRKRAFWILLAVILATLGCELLGWSLVADILFYPVLIAILVLGAANLQAMLRQSRDE